jgi:hypothetical protein
VRQERKEMVKEVWSSKLPLLLALSSPGNSGDNATPPEGLECPRHFTLLLRQARLEIVWDCSPSWLKGSSPKPTGKRIQVSPHLQI